MKQVVLPCAERQSLAFYLAMEDYLAGMGYDDICFVWQSEPTVIIGRNQVLENEVNLGYCRENSVRVIRRKSGGGCVYSDGGNIMISCIYKRADAVDVFDRYLASLTECLCSIGLPAERSGRNDILVDGRKVSGNAFHQLPSRSIVHGTLLYSVDMPALESAIRPPVEKLQRHGVESVRQRVRNIADYATSLGLRHEALQSSESLKHYLENFFCDGTLMLGEEDVRQIENIEKEYLKL